MLLAFWTTTLEVAADAWRIELAPTQEEQGPIVAANLWGYRTAMVAAGSGALLDRGQPRLAAGSRPPIWLIAAAAFAAASRSSPRCGPDPDGTRRPRRRRWRPGLAASAAILLAAAAVDRGGRLACCSARPQAPGSAAKTNVTP